MLFSLLETTELADRPSGLLGPCVRILPAHGSLWERSVLANRFSVTFGSFSVPSALAHFSAYLPTVQKTLSSVLNVPTMAVWLDFSVPNK